MNNVCKIYLMSISSEERLAGFTRDSIEVVAQGLVPTYETQLVLLEMTVGHRTAY